VTKNGALFLFEEVGPETVKVQLGARYENQDNTVDDPSLPDRSFDGVSGSAGVVWKPSPGWALAGSLSRSARLPTPEELYANGPHLATFQFVVGDPNLKEESSLGVDVSVRRLTGRVTGELTFFANRFDDYIFLQATGSEVDLDGELVPEFRYLQTDADYRGAEAHVDFELLHKEPHHLQLELTADTVRAEERDTDRPLGIGAVPGGEHSENVFDSQAPTPDDRFSAEDVRITVMRLRSSSSGSVLLSSNLLRGCRETPIVWHRPVRPRPRGCPAGTGVHRVSITLGLHDPPRNPRKRERATN
jgi:hypothetical protein